MRDGNFWPSIFQKVMKGQFKIGPNMKNNEKQANAKTGVNELKKQASESYKYPCHCCKQMFSSTKACSG